MSDFNLNVDSKAIRKLIDTTASGVGAVAGHWFTRGRAKAEADKIRIIAQAQKDAEDIATGNKTLNSDGKPIAILKNQENTQVQENCDAGIEARLSYQEHKRQSNLRSIVHKAAENISEEVSDEEVDQDWISRFFTHAQDVSSEEMQEIWANLLATEIEKPGKVSLRTLEHLKNLTKAEAKLFEKIKPYVLDDTILRSICEPQEKYNISFEEILTLQQANLIDPNWRLKRAYDSQSHDKYIANIKINDNYGINVSGDFREKISISVLCLTKSGIELFNNTPQVDISQEYLKEFFDIFTKLNLEVSEIQTITIAKP